MIISVTIRCTWRG